MDSFKSLQDSISAALVSTTRSATQIGAADIPFQRSLDPALGNALDEQNARLLQLAQRLLENAAASSDAVGPRLPDVEAIDSNWRGVVDVVDSLLEKADTSLDEYTGVVKRLSPSVDQSATAPKSHFKNAPRNFQKPQLSFEYVPQNNDTGGFKPLMTSKPHAKVPIEDCLKTFKDSNDREQYPHPYRTEIETYEYPPSMYQTAEPIPYSPFESSIATFVDTPEALAMMLAELKTAREIAIDLEHHDNRSYIGIVSLMQVSTRNKDWIVDTLKPWRRRLECLNEVFADPNVLKVLHGAYMDIVWLQRDLGLYIVGLFDTFHAARTLGYTGASLAFLLDHFVDFKAQKQYQMADWRVRPLSDELFTYARADTHFLLYIFDNMRNELIAKSDFSDPEKDKVLDVLNKSRETALQRYEYPIYDVELGLGPVGWYRLLTRTPVQYTPQQFAVFKAVHKWRDDVARQEDESTVFIMPNHAIFSVARTLPEDKAALFNVTHHVSPILRARADELVRVITMAKAAGEDGPDMNETIKKIEEIKGSRKAQLQHASNMDVDPIPASAPAPVPALQQAPFVATLDNPPLRAQTSAFWGVLWSQATTEQRQPVSTLSVSLALPLPPLTAEIFADTAEDSMLNVERPQHAFVLKKERPVEDLNDDIFIVRHVGGRKRTRAEEPAASEDIAGGNEIDADQIMLELGDLRFRKKKEKKARKKALKKQSALAQTSSTADCLNYDDEPAFDYAAAPSVLNAQGMDADQARNGKKRKDKKIKNQGFNPYAKLQDVSKGLPRSQKESAGRSKTFTS